MVLKASLKKQNKLAKKAVNPDIAKIAISQVHMHQNFTIWAPQKLEIKR